MKREPHELELEERRQRQFEVGDVVWLNMDDTWPRGMRWGYLNSCTDNTATITKVYDSPRGSRLHDVRLDVASCKKEPGYVIRGLRKDDMYHKPDFGDRRILYGPGFRSVATWKDFRRQDDLTSPEFILDTDEGEKVVPLCDVLPLCILKDDPFGHAHSEVITVPRDAIFKYGTGGRD